MEYETVIGLEVHVQVDTNSKMFTRAPRGFGEPPNTLTDPVVLGLPGALPVMNFEAIEKSIRVGLLLGCDIAKVCKWDRKNYFYPDMPKNYQISQFDQPICEHGHVEIELPGENPAVMGKHRRVQLTRIHLEEDVGKLTHTEHDSLVDYNRAGSALLEIVSEPDLFSPEEVFAYLNSLRNSLIYSGISDCDMEKGQLRCDANISIRPVGTETLGTKVELKNLNTISGVRNGVEYEIKRQTSVLLEGGTIVQETRRWNPEQRYTTAMRTKEMAHDYRYFPDPDLLPLVITQAYVDEIAATLPELPDAKQARFIDTHALSAEDSGLLVADKETADYFEAVAETGGDAKLAANWTIHELFAVLNREGLSINDSPVAAGDLGKLVGLIHDNTISGRIAKDVFEIMLAEGGDPETIVEETGLKQITDSGEIEALVDQVIADNPEQAQQFRDGNPKVGSWFVGQVMQASKGKANPGAVNELLKKKLG